MSSETMSAFSSRYVEPNQIFYGPTYDDLMIISNRGETTASPFGVVHSGDVVGALLSYPTCSVLCDVSGCI